MTTEIKFRAKLIRLNSGGTVGFSVPKAFAELLEVNERYTVRLLEDGSQVYRTAKKN